MELHARILGSGPPVVLLHGLFGSKENLGGIARALADRYTAYGLDLRNHGRSNHGRRMDYPTLAADVRETLDAHALAAPAVIGHSLGGKTAMELALSTPDRVSALVVLDIAPIVYDRRHDQELDSLRGLDLARVRSRADADEQLQARIPDPAIRQFLLKNLTRGATGFEWRIPLDAIAAAYPDIAAAPSATDRYAGPTLFIRGGASDYVSGNAESAIRDRFPNARVETVRNAAHWLHVEDPDTVATIIRDFLAGTRLE